MLKHKIAIFIPSTVAANKKVSPALVRKMVMMAKNKFADDGTTHFQEIRAFAAIVAKAMSQECVTIEVDGVVDFISP